MGGMWVRAAQRGRWEEGRGGRAEGGLGGKGALGAVVESSVLEQGASKKF